MGFPGGGHRWRDLGTLNAPLLHRCRAEQGGRCPLFAPPVKRKGCSYEQEEAVKLAAAHLGFQRVGPAIAEAFRSAINGTIRRGLLT